MKEIHYAVEIGRSVTAKEMILQSLSEQRFQSDKKGGGGGKGVYQIVKQFVITEEGIRLIKSLEDGALGY